MKEPRTVQIDVELIFIMNTRSTNYVKNQDQDILKLLQKRSGGDKERI